MRINLQNVLGNFISERLTVSLTSTNGPKDKDVAAVLFEHVQPILNCTSYSFENEDTLDHDFNIELIDDDSPFENNEDDDENIDDDCNRNGDSHDTDHSDKCKNGNTVRHQFSLEYMENVVQFYDERNRNIRKRKNIRKDKFQFLLRNSQD